MPTVTLDHPHAGQTLDTSFAVYGEATGTSTLTAILTKGSLTINGSILALAPQFVFGFDNVPEDTGYTLKIKDNGTDMATVSNLDIDEGAVSSGVLTINHPASATMQRRKNLIAYGKSTAGLSLGNCKVTINGMATSNPAQLRAAPRYIVRFGDPLSGGGGNFSTKYELKNALNDSDDITCTSTP